MLNILNLKIESFGLDISDLSLKLIRLQEGRNGFSISTINQIPLPEKVVSRGEVIDVNKLVQNIRKLVSKTRNLDTKYVAVCLPEEKSFLRVIKMPKMSAGELKKAVRFEAENYIPFSLDKVYLDSQVIGQASDEQLDVLIVAMPKRIINPYVEAIKKAGLKLVALETESQAAARSLIKGGLTKEPVYLIDLGATSTSFSLFYGNSLRFASYIPISSNSFTLAIAKKLKKEKEEAESLKKVYGLKNSGETGKAVYEALEPRIKELVAEIQKHIDYYENYSKINDVKKAKEVLFYGGGAELAGLSEYLAKKLHLKVRQGDPLVDLWPGAEKFFKKKKMRKTSFTVAIGLALRQFEE